jgi:hypothetical protein
MRRALAAAAFLLVLWPHPAPACTCEVPLSTFPVDGATDVPLDSAIYVWGSAGDHVGLFAADLAVTGATATSLWSQGDWRAARLTHPALGADTVYELRDGATVLATFTTGQAVSSGVPTVAIAELTPEEASYDDPTTCGSGLESLGLVVSGNADLISISLGASQELIVPLALLPLFGSPSQETCHLELGLAGRDSLCVTLAGVSPAGQVGLPVTRCAPVAHCASVPSDVYELDSCPAPATGAGAGCSIAPGHHARGGLGLGLGLVILGLAWRRRSTAASR